MSTNIEKSLLRKSIDFKDHIRLVHQTTRQKLDSIPNVNEKFEKKKYQVIQQLQCPFVEKKKMSKTTRNARKRLARNPLMKLIKVGSKHLKHQKIQNVKLIRILERL